MLVLRVAGLFEGMSPRLIRVNLGFDNSRDPVAQMRMDSDTTFVQGMRLAARQALAAGITTIRELGDSPLPRRYAARLVSRPSQGPRSSPPVHPSRSPEATGIS